MIVVGFERNFTSVDEGDGSFVLCVLILTEAELLPTHTNFSFFLALATVSGTAGNSRSLTLHSALLSGYIQFQILVITLKSPPPTTL